jgi:EamA domain-containing membrane protein RarD
MELSARQSIQSSLIAWRLNINMMQFLLQEHQESFVIVVSILITAVNLAVFSKPVRRIRLCVLQLMNYSETLLTLY